MGQGLGKNSPVVLSLGKENYEALIERHGQWVRWRVATKCPCAEKGSPALHCKKCGGLGFTYSFQNNKIVTQTVMCTDTSGIIELAAGVENYPLVKLYDNNGNVYGKAEKSGVFVILNTEKLPVKGSYVTAVMTEATLKHLEKAECEKIGAGYYRVKGLRISKTNIDGLYHTVPADIERIGKITDANGVEYIASELRQDTFYIEPEKNADELEEKDSNADEEEIDLTPDIDGDAESELEKTELAEPLTVENVDYIPPVLFVLLNQNLNKADSDMIVKYNGDAIVTFPYNCDVSNDDVITVLSGTYTQKDIIKRKINSDFDVIEAYFVDRISSCIGKEREYVSGIDFILCGSNRIKWLCEDLPEEGENYSITYAVFPTYKVMQNIPQIRTSENQQMPKKAVVKLVTTYGEKRGINKQ